MEFDTTAKEKGAAVQTNSSMLSPSSCVPPECINAKAVSFGDYVLGLQLCLQITVQLELQVAGSSTNNGGTY
jgi:hypothetical protein